MEKLKPYILSFGIIACALAIDRSAIEPAMTSKYIVWCVVTLALVLCTRRVTIDYTSILMVCFMVVMALSGFSAINQSEWFYSVIKIGLMAIFLLVAKIDKDHFAKTMICLGAAFSWYLWTVCFSTKSYAQLGYLMSCKSEWALANVFVIICCYHAIKSGWWVKVSWVVGLLAVVNVLLPKSRAGILALCACIVIAGIKEKRLVLYCTGLLIIGAAVYYAQPSIASTTSMEQRMTHWSASIDMVAANPLGVGAGNWPINFPNFARGINLPKVYTKLVFLQPDNDFLLVLCEGGYFGLLVYFGVFCFGLYRARDDTLSIMCIVAFMAVALFSGLMERAFASMVLFTVLAIGCRGRKMPVSRFVFIPILCLMLVVFGFRHINMRQSKALNKTMEWSDIRSGESVFSRLTHHGIPWAWWRGTGYVKDDNDVLALEEYKRAHRLSPYNIYVLNSLGALCGNMGEYNVAIACFREAVDICPEYEDAQLNLNKINAKMVVDK